MTQSSNNLIGQSYILVTHTKLYILVLKFVIVLIRKVIIFVISISISISISIKSFSSFFSSVQWRITGTPGEE